MFKTTDLVKSVFQLLFYAAIAWLLYTVRGMIIYLIIGAGLTVMGKPLVRLFRKIPLGKLQLPMWVCSLLTIAVMVLVISGVTGLIVPEFVREVGVLSKINYSEVFNRFEEDFSAAQTLLADWEVLPQVSESDLRDSVTSLLNIGTVKSTFGSLIGGLGNIGVAIFSIVFILFFFLKEEKLADAAIDNFIADKYTEQVRKVVPKAKRTLTRYLLGLNLQLVSIFLMLYFGLSIVGFENTIIIALFAATVNVIPYIGPIIGISFGLVLGLGQELAMDPNLNLLTTAGSLLAVFVVVQLIDNIISQPLIFSNSINAHPLEIFIVISVAGTLAGIAGMVVAVPLYSVLRIIAKEFNVNVKFIRTLSRNA